MIDMRVRENDRLDVLWFERKGLVDPLRLLAMALVHTALKEDFFIVIFDEVKRTGNSSRRADERDIHYLQYSHVAARVNRKPVCNILSAEQILISKLQTPITSISGYRNISE
jgi:hypothetical protein